MNMDEHHHSEIEEDSEIKEILTKIKEAGMPEEIEEKARKEAKKLAQMTQFNPEAGYIRNYLEWLVELPWSKESKNNVDVKSAEKILNEDHFGLKDAKERIVEYLAVHKLAGKMKGPILCFVGPPGVGKTSIGKSIARALGREFVKVSLGGIRDEAEIRGHRRTYVGALPGRIIQGIKDAKTKNPVFMLDEIDKVGADFRGDPSSALLEALDPEQNHSFTDYYLDYPVDLSSVLFVATANNTHSIATAVMDRLEPILMPSYTDHEKIVIGQKYMLPKLLEQSGLTQGSFSIADDVWPLIVRPLGFDAGIRTLQRNIEGAVRKAARMIIEGKKQKVEVNSQNVKEFLPS